MPNSVANWTRAQLRRFIILVSGEGEGALKVDDLIDASTNATDSTTPTGGQVLAWSTEHARWQPTAAPGDTDAVTMFNGKVVDRLITVAGSAPYSEINGEANLTYDGSTFIVNDNMTVGVNDAGHDVTLYGDTDDKKLLWDTSLDKLVIVGNNGSTALDVEDGNVNIADSLTVAGDFTFKGTAITATGAELNILDGVTATAAELNAACDASGRTAGTVAVADDHFLFCDGGATGATKVESIADLATGIAGDGIAATSGVLKLDINELSAATVDVANDSIAIIDANASNASKKEAIADVVSAIAGDGIAAASGVLKVDVSDFAGTGLEDDGSENLRITAQGNGLAGGGSSPLSVGGNITGITSIYNTALKIGSAVGQEYISFVTTNEINTVVNGVERLKVDGNGAAVTGALTVSTDLTVTGDLTVNGDTVTTNVATISIEDPLIKLANGNSSTDTVDIGFYGLCDPSNSQDTYTGLFRDATDSSWHLFDLLQTEPTTTVNKSATGFDHADLTVGALTADDASTFSAGLGCNDTNITNVGDIDCDTISVADAANGLQVQFGGVTTTNKITLTDNLAEALTIEQDGNDYMKFVTTNSGEKIQFDKPLDINAAVQIDAIVNVGTDAGAGYNVIFHSATQGDNFAWSDSAAKLTITGTNGQTALDVADGNLVVADTLDLNGVFDGDVSTFSAVCSSTAEITVADGNDLTLGNAVKNAYFMVAAHSSAGSEDLRIINTEGTDAKAIEILAIAGGVSIECADGKEAYIGNNAKDAYVTVAAHGTDGSEDIRIVNTNGTDAAAIEVTATAGGILLNVDTVTKKIHLDSEGFVDIDSPIEIKSTAPIVSDVHDFATTAPFSLQAFDGDGDGGGRIIKFEPGSSSTLTLGALYFLHTDGTWDAVNADNPATGASQLLGIAMGTSARSDGMLLNGFVRIPSTQIEALSAGSCEGKPLYVSEAAGRFDFNPPDAFTYFVRVVGYALEDNGSDVLVYFNPDPTWVEIS